MPETNTRDVPNLQPGVTTVVGLYDTALTHIAKAATAAKGGDFETQMNEVLAAVRIFSGLDSCLDVEQGGAVAANLRDMYQSVTRALLSAIGQPSASETCGKLMVGLRETRNAWAEIAGMAKIAES